MSRVLILGKDGMLGTMVSRYLKSLKEYEIYLTSRRDKDIDDNVRKFDVSIDSLEGLVDDINPEFLIIRGPIGILATIIALIKRTKKIKRILRKTT